MKRLIATSRGDIMTPHNGTRPRTAEGAGLVMQHIGIDVHKNSCQVCILSEDGALFERRIETDSSTLHTLCKDRQPARLLIESSTEGERVARCLEGFGHEFTVADPNFAPMCASRSKAGNGRDRSLLVEAAWALLRWKTPKTQGLHEWAMRVAARRGKATAVVALARKLAGILFALWRDGTEFDPGHGLGVAES